MPNAIFNKTCLSILRTNRFSQNSITFKNKNIFYLEYLPKHHNKNTEKTVTILPGYGDSVFSWTHVLLWLSRQGYRVLALDFPGYMGMTPALSNGAPIQFSEHEAIAEQFVNETAPSGMHALIGNSLGGWFSMRLAARYSQLVKSVIAVNPAGVITSWDELDKTREMYNIRTYSEFLALMKLMWHRIPKYFYAFSLLGFYQYAKRKEFKEIFWNLDESHFVDHLLPDIKAPLHVIWGQSDRLFGHDLGKMILEKHPDTHYYPIPNCGHMPQLEKPFTFIKMLRHIL